ncbi:PREDICTED: pro-cathepsin H-like [Papilio polytes]|uniref:pro-cathepsin H-like n=1 Tax=Papilio polytes TaxID=76194 RepID=UPI000675F2E2|nr:PREDICTED: pro-cathepsin H-like [Papilio polytes]
MAVSGRRSDSDDTPVDVDTLLDNIEAPEEFDWRDKNVVTDVKDQQGCGACWAFSSTGAAEGQYAIKHSELLSLSEKQLIDCWDQSGGCTGNAPDRGLNAAAKMGGFMLERDYPYKPSQNKCSFQKNKVAVRVKGGRTVTVDDEEKLKDLVYQTGPVSTGFYANKEFSSYRGQMYDGKGCPKGKKPNHAMLIVGYGVENGTPYWMIKNSYNVHWGANGYLKLIRGVNACSLLNYTAVAEVE